MGVNFPRDGGGGGSVPGGGGGGGQKILGENEKLHNYGIKTNYFNLL